MAFFASLDTGSTAAPGSSAAPTSGAPDVRPGQVTVSVLNGSGITGAAAAGATALGSAGFRAGSGGNATRTGTTTGRYHSGDDAAAALVAAQVPGAAVTVDDSVPAGTVQLVIGGDYNGMGKAVTATSSAASSTAYAGNERTATDTSCIN